MISDSIEGKIKWGRKEIGDLLFFRLVKEVIGILMRFKGCDGMK